MVQVLMDSAIIEYIKKLLADMFSGDWTYVKPVTVTDHYFVKMVERDKGTILVRFTLGWEYVAGNEPTRWYKCDFNNDDHMRSVIRKVIYAS